MAKPDYSIENVARGLSFDNGRSELLAEWVHCTEKSRKDGALDSDFARAKEIYELIRASATWEPVYDMSGLQMVLFQYLSSHRRVIY